MRLKSLFKPKRKKVIDLRQVFADVSPVEACQFAQGSRALINIPISKVVCMEGHGVDFGNFCIHPFLRCALKIKNENDSIQAKQQLSSFYSTVIPSSAAEFLDVDAQSLKRLPALCGEVPWRSVSGAHVKKKRIERAYKENREAGIELSGEQGFHMFGPIATAKLDIEFKRISALVESVSSKGFNQDKFGGPISGFVLCNDFGEWTWYLAGGQHRVAVAAAFGVDRLSAVVKPERIIHRRSVDNWPAVKKGQLNRTEALAIFDRLLKKQISAYLETHWVKEAVDI